MKVLIIGVFNENSTNTGIANGFEKNQCEVIRYQYRKQEKILGARKRNEEIIKLCNTRKPELVFFCKCNGVDISVVHECNKVSKTFLWYMDPLNGNYNFELQEKIRHCTGAGLAKYEVYLLARQLNSKSYFLIEGFDPEWDYPIEGEKIYDVSFIGSLYGGRQKYKALSNITFVDNAYNVEHSMVVGKSKINLNFTNGGGPSDRLYKIMAAGGFVLSEPFPHMDKYGIAPNEDFIVFNNIEDLKEKINFYLINEKERNWIAQQGYNHVQQFSRNNLAKKVLDIIQNV